LEKSLVYNPDLIELLKNDHKSLFKIYKELIFIYNNNSMDFKRISEKLHDFKLALEVHLMVEDTQLYGYLEQKYANIENHRNFIKDVEHEMETIAKEVLNFVRKYSNYEMFKKYNANFIDELQKIGKVLTKRVETEEKRLYILYRP